MSDDVRIALIIVAALWGVLSMALTGLVHQDTQETLRLLKRGDKVDCRMSEMKGTLP